MNTKRDWEHELKNAIPPFPEDCHQALMDAARSVQEEQKPMKRNITRTVILVFALLISMMTAAYAASQLGLADFFGSRYVLTESAREALAQTKQQTWEVGPVTFTLREAIADGHLAYVAVDARMTDGEKALLVNPDAYADDPIQPDTLEIVHAQKGETWIDLGKRLGLPVYQLRCDQNLDETLLAGEQMIAGLSAEDGSALCISETMTNPDAVQDTLPVSLYIRVRQIDENGETMEGRDWRLNTDIVNIPVGAIRNVDGSAPQVYPYAAESASDGSQPVTGAELAFTSAGAYLTITYQAPEGLSLEEAYEDNTAIRWTDLCETVPCDAQGNRLPNGIAMFWVQNNDHWPVITTMHMLGLEEAPETIVLTDPYHCTRLENITLKLQSK